MTKAPAKAPTPLKLKGADLRLEYILVRDAIALELDGNAKLHDDDTIWQLIVENGFRDPPAYDQTLNGGQGGIVYGNGRTGVLWAHEQAGDPAPRGIIVTDQGWAMPMLFGLDAASEDAAKRFSIDHNISNVSGSGLSDYQIAQMFDPEGYLEFLGELEDADALPLTVPQAALDFLRVKLNDDELEDASGDPDDQTGADGDAGADSGDAGATTGETGTMLELVSVAIAEPRHQVKTGEMYALGDHLLACMNPATDWGEYMPYLTGNTLLLAYPSPYAPLSEQAQDRAMLLVQPDPYLAGHLLDRYAEVHGDDRIHKL